MKACAGQIPCEAPGRSSHFPCMQSFQGGRPPKGGLNSPTEGRKRERETRGATPVSASAVLRRGQRCGWDQTKTEEF